MPETAENETLGVLLEQHTDDVRDASYVMSPAVLGAARLTRFSFSRSVLRRADANGWKVALSHLDLDDRGQGEAAYRVEAEGHVFHFVAFLQELAEQAHTDRVIAERWEIVAALIEGELTRERWDHLRVNVPEQERGRLDHDVLSLTRGNRSVRFFDYLIDELAAGRQPDPDHVGDAGYIMRSTAFYGNGKYGMRSYGGYPAGHPLAAPYRAQFIAAWCFRELSYDVIEECARLRGGESAVPFGGEWRTFFGLGNATGLGLVPYMFKHPRIVNGWVAVRELALAKVRNEPGTPASAAALDRWIERARQHFVTGTDTPADPFLCPAELVPVVDAIRGAWEKTRGDALPFDSLMRWAMTQGAETSELVASLLVELDDTPDDVVDNLLHVNEHTQVDLSISAAAALDLIADRFGWIDDLGLDSDSARSFWWVYSDNTEEPRRTRRGRLDVGQQDFAIDVVNHMFDLRAALRDEPESSLSAVLADHPHLIDAAGRLFVSDQPYGEPRDNPAAETYLPLQVQRFQLAMYGMDNFKPKSTDWLRVTLFQGAPRISDLEHGLTDDWVLPPMPQAQEIS